MYVAIVIFVCALVGVDQFSKYLAVNILKPQNTISIIDNIFSLTFVENRGAAFGIFQGRTTILSVITIFIVIGIIYFYIKLPKNKVYTWLRFSLILIISGALGNFIDRVRQGYVVDFFHATFINFPVFNIADIYVVTGAILMAILVIFFIKEEEKE